MAGGIVQSNSAAVASGTTISPSLGAATTVGNQLFIYLATTGTPTTPSNFGVDDSVSSATGTGSLYLYRKLITVAETSWSITVTSPSVWYAAEISGISTAPLDQTTIDAGANDAAVTPATTQNIAQAVELIMFAAMGVTTNTGPVTFSGWSAFTELADLGNAAGTTRVALGIAGTNVNGVAGYTSTATLSASANNCGIMTTYRDAVGAPVFSASRLFPFFS